MLLGCGVSPPRSGNWGAWVIHLCANPRPKLTRNIVETHSRGFTHPSLRPKGELLMQVFRMKPKGPPRAQHTTPHHSTTQHKLKHKKKKKRRQTAGWSHKQEKSDRRHVISSSAVYIPATDINSIIGISQPSLPARQRSHGLPAPLSYDWHHGTKRSAKNNRAHRFPTNNTKLQRSPVILSPAGVLAIALEATIAPSILAPSPTSAPAQRYESTIVTPCPIRHPSPTTLRSITVFSPTVTSAPITTPLPSLQDRGRIGGGGLFSLLLVVATAVVIRFGR